MFSSRSSHVPTWTKVLGCRVILFSLSCLLLCTVVQAAPPLIINEYNAVASKKYFDGGDYLDGWDDATGTWPDGLKEDAYFRTIDGLPNGRIEGNGGNWIELVIVEDGLNIQGWELRWAETDLDEADDANGSDIWYGDGTVEQGIITFSDADVWADLRAGTILTISEKYSIEVDIDVDDNDDYNTTNGVGAIRGDVVIDLMTDTETNFDPVSDKWWMHVSTRYEYEFNADDPLITTVTNVTAGGVSIDDSAGNFSVGPGDWQVEIFNAAGVSQYGPTSENDDLNNGNFRGNLNDKESVVLEAHPGDGPFDNSNYDDRTSTTFGMPNEWGGTHQDFDPLRDWFQTPAAWLTTNTGDPDTHALLVSAAVGQLPVPGPALFEFTDVGVGTDVTVALIGSEAYLAILDTTLGMEGLLYEAEGGLFNAFTFKPSDPADFYELYLWDEGWGLNDELILPGTEFTFDTAQSDFLIWGVEVNPLGISAGDFLTDLKITSTAKGPVDVYVTPVPEPGSMVMVGCAILGLLLLRRRRR